MAPARQAWHVSNAPVQDYSPVSPEARRQGSHRRLDRRLARAKPGSFAREFLRRVIIGVLSEGFVHAGNLAYLSLVTLFPFFIVAAAIARVIGRTDVGLDAVNSFLDSVPPSVANVLKTPINDVLVARSGSLLWFGALVGLWTTASYVETIRDIVRRAYGVKSQRPFWQYRLGSIALILGSLLLVLVAFSLQVSLAATEQFLTQVMPFARRAATVVHLTRLIPLAAVFGALYTLFWSLTPQRYGGCPKWPGAAFTAFWWQTVTAFLPVVITSVTRYDLTYGSLAGVMIALIYFFLIGLGIVVGAQINAALAEADQPGVESGAYRRVKNGE